MVIENSMNTKASIKEVLKSMAENSSIHGVSRWVTSRHWYQRLLWILVFLAAAGVLSYQLSRLFGAYKSYPVKTSVELKFSSLPFPAVSICNMNPIKMTKLYITSTDTQKTINGTYTRKKRSVNRRSNKETKVSFSSYLSPGNGDKITNFFPLKEMGIGQGGPALPAPLMEREPYHSVELNKNKRKYKNNNKHSPKSWLSMLLAKENINIETSKTEPWFLKSNQRVRKRSTGSDGTTSSGNSGSTFPSATDSPSSTTSGSYTTTNSYYHTSTYGWIGSDGTWSSFQDYMNDLDQHVQDEWSLRVAKFQSEFQKNTREIRENVGHAISDMLVSCAFNGNECYHSNFSLFQSLEYGNCYTFQDTSYITKRSGPLLGLRLTLNIETFEYVKDYMDAFGMRLVIHEPGTFPFPEEEGFTLNPNFETTIGMKLVTIQRASEPHGNCESGEDFTRMFGIRYTIPACLKLCRQREIISQCQCIPSTSYIKIGNTDSLPLCSNSTDASRCEEFLVFKLENNLLDCNCRSPCRQIIYDTSLSGRAWPSQKFLKENIMADICDGSRNWFFAQECNKVLQNYATESEIESLSGNFLKAVIYYEDLNYEEIREEPMYDGFQLISDVGGALGLFMGASIMSFVEIFQFFIELLNFLRSKVFRRPTSSLTPVTDIYFKEPIEKEDQTWSKE
ncbi:amiloride-sensitive sodium channel subunit alpha-like [Saccostrea cucullata]|uniref:amiloride-sensitive sodium channel subunit alpha-like n=1 Tax=Saccostrea cuccullata TaxID=36930 RepID=UPI002ED1D3F1